MCVIFLAYQKHPRFPLVLLANRDEFYERPTQAARNWEDFPNIFAGRDLIAGGTWLGVSKAGKFGAVTNYRDPNGPTGSRTRGNLVADFLKTDESAESYLMEIQEQSREFSGFNVLLGEISRQRDELFYYSSRADEIRRLTGGIYGLSNHLLDTPWQKVEKGKAFLKQSGSENFSKEACFGILHDETLAEDTDLPDTGIGYEREKALSAIFIKTATYGTRCSSVLTFDENRKFEFEERVFV